jgi:predicted ATPase
MRRIRIAMKPTFRVIFAGKPHEEIRHHRCAGRGEDSDHPSVEIWRQPSFIDAIARLQKDRLIRASCQPDEVQFHDRSVVCTAALAVYLGYPFSPLLASELERVKKEAIYQNRVFFIRNLGFITPTQARRISFEETVRFEKIHEDTYRDFGFELISVGRGSLAERVGIIKAGIR